VLSRAAQSKLLNIAALLSRSLCEAGLSAKQVCEAGLLRYQVALLIIENKLLSRSAQQSFIATSKGAQQGCSELLSKAAQQGCSELLSKAAQQVALLRRASQLPAGLLSRSTQSQLAA
jgi:hypothetical protein